MSGYSIRVLQKIIILMIPMLAGFIAKKSNIIDEKNTKGLSSLLAYVTNSCLIICSLQTDYNSQKLFKALCIFVLSIFIHSFLLLLINVIFRGLKNKKSKVVYQFTFMYNNCGFMGYPIMMAVFGDKEGLFLGVIYTTVFNLFCWSHGVYLMNSSETKKVSFKKIFLNPGIISIIISMTLFLSKIRLPSVVFEGLDMVGSMTFPLSMIIIGSLLADMSFVAIFKDIKLYCYSILKLTIIPIIVIFVCSLLKLPQYIALTAVIMTSTPSATNTAIFAEIYNQDSKLAARIVGMTTVLSLFSMPLIMTLSEKLL